MPVDIYEPLYSSDRLADAAGCREGTFRQWRSRHGLVADADPKKFTLVDVCVVRAVQVMIASGVGATDAVAATLAENELRLQIIALLSEGETDKPFSTLFGFHTLSDTKPARGNSSDVQLAIYYLEPKDIAEMIKKTKGIMIVLDVMAVIKHVLKALKIPASRK